MLATLYAGLASACLLSGSPVIAQGTLAPPTNVRVVTTEPTAVFLPVGQRPYTADSPWNTPIPSSAPVDARSSAMIATIRASNTGRLRSDPNQYTYPTYFANAETPRVTMSCSGTVSTIALDGTRVSAPDKRMTNVPMPAGVRTGGGDDQQLIIIDSDTGDEYDIFEFIAPTRCTNMTRYVRGVARSAADFTSYTSRGAGVPYLAGLIRPWEIAQGQIDHALAFAYPLIPAQRCVYPAVKTDGSTTGRTDVIPEGARLQLNPSLDVNAIPGLSAAGKAIARALQVYGAYVVDVSGANKLYPEDNVTANWGTTLTVSTVDDIPVDQLRVLRLPDAYRASTYTPNYGKCVR